MAIDPPVKTKITVDPDTGARVFNQSWSSELKKKQPIQRKPVSRDTFVTEKKVVTKPSVKPVAKETTVKNSGGRKFNEVIAPSTAKAVGMDLKANVNIKEKAPRDWREVRKEEVKAKAEITNKNLLQENPGMKLEDIKRKIQKNKDAAIRKSNRSVKDGGGSFSNDKNRSAACTTC